MTNYETKALAMIGESRTCVYWFISRRMHRALKRLEKRGVIDWQVANYPYWKFTIKKQTPPLTVCPSCGGPADNGFDRCLPPNPYYCSKCENK